MKMDRDLVKIMLHLTRFKKIKHWSEIEGSNMRVIRKGKELLKHGVLVHKEGYIQFSDKKLTKAYQNMADEQYNKIHQESNLDLRDKQNNDLISDLSKMPKAMVDHIEKNMGKVIKRLKK